jgi:hypothetical protein
MIDFSEKLEEFHHIMELLQQNRQRLSLEFDRLAGMMQEINIAC